MCSKPQDSYICSISSNRATNSDKVVGNFTLSIVKWLTGDGYVLVAKFLHGLVLNDEMSVVVVE